MTPPTPDDAGNETPEKLLAEANARLALLEAARPKSVDGFAISSISKLPFMALKYRESLLWRVVQLARCALENFENNKLAAAILLTRATVETSAALWYLRTKIENVIESKTLGSIHNDLIRLSVGSKTDIDILPTAVN